MSSSAMQVLEVRSTHALPAADAKNCYALATLRPPRLALRTTEGLAEGFAMAFLVRYWADP